MPRPALTRSRIVAAGVVVVSEVGLPALDLRAVARRVNTTATGVQRHIGATELVESVVDEIVQSMPAVPGGGDWFRRVRLWAVETRTWLAGYPGVARHLLVTRGGGVGLDRPPGLVDALDDIGLAPAGRVMAASTLYRFVLSSSDLDESAAVLGGQLSASPAVGWSERWPSSSGPASRETSARSSSDVQFAFALDLLIEGIGSRVGTASIRPAAFGRGSLRSSVRI